MENDFGTIYLLAIEFNICALNKWAIKFIEAKSKTEKKGKD